MVTEIDDSWLLDIYEEIKGTVEDPEEEDVYLSDAQCGLPNRHGVEPDKYLARFSDWRDVRDLLDTAVAFEERFEATQ
jgi:hypothetical protein